MHDAAFTKKRFIYIYNTAFTKWVYIYEATFTKGVYIHNTAVKQRGLYIYSTAVKKNRINSRCCAHKIGLYAEQ